MSQWGKVKMNRNSKLKNRKNELDIEDFPSRLSANTLWEQQSGVGKKEWKSLFTLSEGSSWNRYSREPETHCNESGAGLQDARYSLCGWMSKSEKQIVSSSVFSHKACLHCFTYLSRTPIDIPWLMCWLCREQRLVTKVTELHGRFHA